MITWEISLVASCDQISSYFFWYLPAKTQHNCVGKLYFLKFSEKGGFWGYLNDLQIWLGFSQPSLNRNEGWEGLKVSLAFSKKNIVSFCFNMPFLLWNQPLKNYTGVK